MIFEAQNKKGTPAEGQSAVDLVRAATDTISHAFLRDFLTFRPDGRNTVKDLVQQELVTAVSGGEGRQMAYQAGRLSLAKVAEADFAQYNV